MHLGLSMTGAELAAFDPFDPTTYTAADLPNARSANAKVAALAEVTAHLLHGLKASATRGSVDDYTGLSYKTSSESYYLVAQLLIGNTDYPNGLAHIDDSEAGNEDEAIAQLLVDPAIAMVDGAGLSNEAKAAVNLLIKLAFDVVANATTEAKTDPSTISLQVALAASAHIVANQVDPLVKQLASGSVAPSDARVDELMDMEIAALLSNADIASALPPTVVRVAVVVSGTVNTFDGEAYAESLAKLLKVRRADVSLVVAAASIRVTADIHANREADAVALVATLRAPTFAAALSGLGVSVESVEEPVVCQVEHNGNDGCLQPAPPPPTTTPPPPFAPPPPPFEDEREDNLNTEGVTIGLGVGVPAACLLICLMLTCYLHRVSGGSIPTYLRVKLSHSNPNMVFLYLPEETRRKMASAIISRRSTMPTISEELGFEKPRTAGLDHTSTGFGDDLSVPKQIDRPSTVIIRTPPAVAPASVRSMPAPYEAQMAFAANADASAAAMAAMAAAEAAVQAPAQSKAVPVQENEDEEQTPNIGGDLASTIDDKRRRGRLSDGSSACESSSQQEAPAASASAMAPATPSDMQTPGDEEEE